MSVSYTHLDVYKRQDMNYARVFGGTRGLQMIETTAAIKNSIIHTHQEYGIYAVKSNITASNLVMNNCGEADLGIFKGGTYNITHSTLANYWDFNTALPSIGTVSYTHLDVYKRQWQNNLKLMRIFFCLEDFSFREI